jgi:DNA polymerase-3 subunit gamma/tau
MSYLVLARKWRPLRFSDLVGQEHVGKTLERAIESKRVAHAFLFTGTRGVGKTTTARILAMALNCEKGPTVDPCGACSACREIKSGIGLDVMEIDGASNRGIDAIRELREQIAYTPAGGKHRIVIIDEVHMLTREAFNALLKSLEEPPPDFIFIFATTEPNKVPETILSRVQRYDFKRISPQDILKRLKFICEAEKLAYEESGLLFLAQKAAGSMRDALTLLDQVIPFSSDKITLSGVKSVLGLVDADLYFRLFDDLLGKNEAEVTRKVSEVFAEGYDLSEFATGMEEHLRHLLLSRIAGLESGVLGLSADETARFAKQSARFQPADLLRMTEILSQLSQRLSRSQAPRFDLEIALLKLCRMDSALDISALLQGEGAGPKKKIPSNPPVNSSGPAGPLSGAAVPPSAAPSAPAGNAPGEVPEPLPAQVAAATAINYLTFKNDWRSVVKNIAAGNTSLGTYLSFSFVLSSSPEEIKLGLPENQKFQYQQAVKPENQKRLKDHMTQAFGYSGNISIEIVPEEKARKHLPADLPVFAKKNISSALQNKESINEAAKKEPIIGTILDMFEGEVI